jgi:hypothetical protein
MRVGCWWQGFVITPVFQYLHRPRNRLLLQRQVTTLGHQHGWGLICPPRLRSVASVLGPARQSPCVLALREKSPHV